MSAFDDLCHTQTGYRCACGDPVSMHVELVGHHCSRWDCGCTMFTTPAEMEEWIRELGNGGGRGGVREARKSPGR
jgi:hypothetical protein